MFETVTQHGEKLSNHDERIEALEKVDEEYGKRIFKLEEQSIMLENAIHKTSTETRNVMREQTEKQTEKLFRIGFGNTIHQIHTKS